MSTDVTKLATWTSADPGVVTLTAPGIVHATGIGDTFVTADWGNDAGTRTISVFPNMPPLPTFEIAGDVYRAGATPASGAIPGAVVEVLDGLVAGRTATSGAPASPRPGFIPSLPPYLPAYYRLLGMPPGVYHLRVTSDGYGTQEQTATVSLDGGPVINFTLAPT
jgi:hypothetical protein